MSSSWKLLGILKLYVALFWKEIEEQIRLKDLTTIKDDVGEFALENSKNTPNIYPVTLKWLLMGQISTLLIKIV